MSDTDHAFPALLQRKLTGSLDGEAFSRTLREVLFCLSLQTPRNILIDGRNSTFCFCSLGDILDIVRNIAPFRPNRPVRIAQITNPADPEQLRILRLLETVLEMEGIAYRFFVDPDEALAWLGK